MNAKRPLRIGSTPTFLVIMLAYAYWMSVAYQPENSGADYRVLLLSMGAWSAVVVVCYTLLLFELSQRRQLVPKDVRIPSTTLMLLAGYSVLLGTSFALKPGGSSLVPWEIALSLLSSIFVVVRPLRSERLTRVFELTVLAVQTIFLYRVVRYAVLMGDYGEIGASFFAGSKSMALFGAVSASLSVLAHVSSSPFTNSLVTARLTALNVMVAFLSAVICFSRAAIVGYAIVIPYLIVADSGKQNTRHALKTTLLLSFLVFLAVGLVPSFREALLVYLRDLYKWDVGFLTSERNYIWVQALSQIAGSPKTLLFGMPEIFGTIPGTSYWHAHNSFVEILRSSGVISLLLLLGAIGMGAKRLSRRDPLTMVALVMVTVQCFFDDVLLWGNNVHFILFWALLKWSRIPSASQADKSGYGRGQSQSGRSGA